MACEPTFYIALLMVANIIDVDGLFNAILTPVKIQPILVLPTVRGPRLAGSGSSASRIELEQFLAIKINSICTKETNIFQTFHMS